MNLVLDQTRHDNGSQMKFLKEGLELIMITFYMFHGTNSIQPEGVTW